MVVEPTMILSPSASSLRSTLIPLQKVPLVDPRSTTIDLLPLAQELAVLARDPLVVQPHADRRAAPDDRLVLLQLEHLARADAGQHDQVGEVPLLLAVGLGRDRRLGLGRVLERGAGRPPDVRFSWRPSSPSF